MAKLLWGKVYYNELLAGYISEESGGAISFKYDENYINSGYKAISCTLPIQNDAFINHSGLHPFFDNLVSEGWLEEAQTKLLGKRSVSRFELLLTFGLDLQGAVSIVDPEPNILTEALLDFNDKSEMAVMAGRASLSGVQPKITANQKNGIFYPSKISELSTYIIKFPSNNHIDIIENEYLTSRALKSLLPDSDIAEMSIGELHGFDDKVLRIKRFDRDNDGGRIHFEEFNQLLENQSQNKYNGAYKDMAEFIYNNQNCRQIESYQLYLRIIAGILLGNIDMHLKNFAMLYNKSELRLAPSYDQVSGHKYGYDKIALKINNSANLSINTLKPSNIIALGEEFKLNLNTIKLAITQLEKQLPKTKDVIQETDFVNTKLKDELIKNIDKRWNRIFTSIGPLLSKRP